MQSMINITVAVFVLPITVVLACHVMGREQPDLARGRFTLRSVLAITVITAAVFAALFTHSAWVWGTVLDVILMGAIFVGTPLLCAYAIYYVCYGMYAAGAFVARSLGIGRGSLGVSTLSRR